MLAKFKNLWLKQMGGEELKLKAGSNWETWAYANST